MLLAPVLERSRRQVSLLAVVLLALSVTTAVVLAHGKKAAAAVVRPFALNYDQDVYGDFLESGNGNMRCPDSTDPADPSTGKVPIADCAPTQARTQNQNNDSFYMRFADVDSNSATFNSSSAQLTIPQGATVDYARLNWSGDTGVYKDANGNQLGYAACGSRQVTLGKASPTPSGSASDTPAVVTVNGTTTNVSSIATTVDPLAGLPNNSPQYYSNYADITSLFSGVPTGSALPLTVGNVWAPQGFGCYAGWSMVVVYKYATANSNAPLKRSVQIFDGHVRQANGDKTTTVSVTGLRVSTTDVRIGLTAYEGDYGITGDQFQVNGKSLIEPLSTNNDTNNFFVSNAENATNPKVANNFSVDAKEFITDQIPTGSTSADLSFLTTGDSYLAENLAVSSPVPSVTISKIPNATTVRAGSPISFSISVNNPTQSPLHNLSISDPQYPACNYTLAQLDGGKSYTSTCTVAAKGDDFSNSASVSGTDDFGGTVTDGPSSSGNVRVINPAITISKTADKTVYNSDDTITYTIKVTNTGDSTLSNTKVYDSNLAGCEKTIGTLASKDSNTYTCTTTAPISGGSNTARVYADDEAGGSVSDTSTAQSPTAGSISGRVIADRENNGVANDSDTGISGVTLTLTGTTTGGQSVNLTTKSGPDGSYSFTQVPPGTYTTTETQPDGFTDGKDTPGTNAKAGAGGNDTIDVTLPDAGTSTGTIFAEVPTGSLSGSVYIDSNNDGARAGGEAGIGGVAVVLSGTDNDGHTLSISATTDANGNYTFPAIRGGTYSVTEAQPNGYVDGKDAAGTAGGTLVDPDTVNAISLANGQQATGYLFGELPQGVIAGSVVADNNGLAGVKVTLTGTDDRGNAVSTTVTTGKDGSYVFSGLRPGTYTVEETQPTGYGAGSASPGGNGGQADGANRITGIALGIGDNAVNNVFTDTTGSLAGTVYEDTDNDGAQQSGEGGISGVRVTVSGTDATGATISKQVQTDNDGHYIVTGLLSGTYTVAETQPSSYLDGKDAAGTAGGTVTAPDSITNVALGGGVAGTGYTFGEIKPASVVGSVVTTDGKPIPGVSLRLTGTDDNGNAVSVTTTTNSDGSYGFTNLRPSGPNGYTVTETQPADYGQGTATPGTAGGTAQGTDVISGITLTAGLSGTGYKFTETAGSLSGVVYDDLDNSGTRDSGEPGIANVTITVTGTGANNNTVSVTVQTDTNGMWTAPGLPAGTYTVKETQPAGYLTRTDTAGDAGGTVGANDTVTGVTLGAGQAATGYLFGEVRVGSVSGTVRDDHGNPLAGVGVRLTGTDSAGNQVDVSTTTGTDGTYSFTNVSPGTYTVTETQPTGYGAGSATVGNRGGSTDGANSVTGIKVGSATAATGYDFTDTTGSLSGAVYEDRNGNGTRDQDEPGIANVTVTVTGTDANGKQVTVGVPTGNDGSWSVSGLLSGTYSVTETQPTGYLDGADTAGSAGGTHSGTDTFGQIALGAGQNGTGYLFGETRPSGISGTVLDDTGKPIKGVTVTVTGTDAYGNPVSVPVTTGDDGSYTVGNLPPSGPDGYTITETQPTGYGAGTSTPGTGAGGTSGGANTITGVTVTSGTTGSGYDFHDTTGSLSGAVYDDLNGNGVRDQNEPGLAGVTVTVTGTEANGAPVTVGVPTGKDGSWSVPGLLSGTYSVTETQPGGYLDGAETIGTAGGTHSGTDTIEQITLDPGQQGTGYLFGETRAGSISGTVLDDNGKPIKGVTVTVTGTDAYGNPVSTKTTTGDDGSYTVGSLPPSGPDGYTVTETQPAGYGDGSATVGTGAGGTTGGSNSVTGITVDSGTTGSGYDFTDSTSSLSGAVYLDTNRNGTRDAGEDGLAGVRVTITGTDAGGNPVSVVVTSGLGGAWSASGLRGGTYSVTETQPAAYADGADTVGTAGGNQTGSDTIEQIALGGGQDGTGYNFGELGGSVSGSVYVDANNNGARDTGEVPIAGVTVTLTGKTADGTSVTRTVTSGTDGSYSVTDLPSGSYSVTETQPKGYADGKDTPGSAGGTAQSPDTITGVTLDPGQQGTGYLFGDRLGVISGIVYLDANRDGTLGSTETVRLGGVTVQLKDATGTVVATTTTAADGSFSFADLAPGDYTVVEQQPAGYGSSTPNSIPVTLTQASGNDVRFGETLGQIGDRVFADKNRNGLQDAAEKGVAGVTVTLYGADGKVVATTKTAADGSYHFDVKAGSYTVGITLPSGQTFTKQGVGDDRSKDSDFAQATGRSGTVSVSVASDGSITLDEDVDGGLVPIVHDLEVTITPDKPTVAPGDTITYTVGVTNQGTVPEKGAQVTVTLPPGVTLTGAQGNGWTCTTSGQVATCTYPGTIEPGASAPPLQVTGTATEPGDMPATVTVTTASGQGGSGSSTTVHVQAAARAPVTPPGGNNGGGLAFTGAPVLGLGGLALLLLVGGGLLLLGSRRRTGRGRHRTGSVSI